MAKKKTENTEAPKPELKVVNKSLLQGELGKELREEMEYLNGINQRVLNRLLQIIEDIDNRLTTLEHN